MDKTDSAGVICFRGDSVLLIRFFSHYSFPKGHIESGEKREETALRECFEETGIRAKIVAPPIRVASARKGDERSVFFFPAIYVGGVEQPQEGESDEALWVKKDEALKLLSFEQDKNALLDAISSLRVVGIDIK